MLATAGSVRGEDCEARRRTEREGRRAPEKGLSAAESSLGDPADSGGVYRTRRLPGEPMRRPLTILVALAWGAMAAGG